MPRKRPASFLRAKPKEGPYVRSKGRQKDFEVRYKAAGRKIARWKEPTLEDIFADYDKRTKNPGAKRMTKTQKRVKAKTAAAKRKVATALATFLKRANPGAKLAGARVQKLGGGVIKITPIKLNRGRR
jgi:hypothetical protein